MLFVQIWMHFSGKEIRAKAIQLIAADSKTSVTFVSILGQLLDIGIFK